MTHRPDDPRRLDALIEQWLDDDLGPAESAELEAAVVESPAVRARFWERAGFDALLHEAVGLVEETALEAGPTWQRERGRFSGFAAAVLAGGILLAVGGGLGALLTKQALAGLARSVAARFVVLSEGFESGVPPLAKYIPVEPGVWSGDATAVVGPGRGVVPLAGAGMLEFVGPHPRDLTQQSEFASEVWRVIPIAEVRDGATQAARASGLDAGALRVELGAAFDQRGAAGEADATARAKVAGVGVFAFRGPVSEVRALWNERVAKALASSQTEQMLDEDPGEWQRLRVTMTVPPETDFLLVVCYVRDSRRRPGTACDGQFMDEVGMSAFLEPTAAGGGS